MNGTSCVAVISGGMDSQTLLYDMKMKESSIRALSFAYGQRHAKELECAEWNCKALGIEHKIVDMVDIGQPILHVKSIFWEFCPRPDMMCLELITIDPAKLANIVITRKNFDAPFTVLPRTPLTCFTKRLSPYSIPVSFQSTAYF